MPAKLKAPTTLARLHALLEGDDQDSVAVEEDTRAWLEWTLDFLTNRKLYHKRQQYKKAFLTRAAKEMLSKDELDEIDRQVEELVEKELEASAPASAMADDDNTEEPTSEITLFDEGGHR